ncbi:MAG: hypothetical protein M3329_04760 [Pseudomonadota bacterium]|nr:hypothetical protein [Pseudomonadota bacterium]
MDEVNGCRKPGNQDRCREAVELPDVAKWHSEPDHAGMPAEILRIGCCRWARCHHDLHNSLPVESAGQFTRVVLHATYGIETRAFAPHRRARRLENGTKAKYFDVEALP